MMRVADSSARCRIWVASARPSTPGMRASSSTSGNGRPPEPRREREGAALARLAFHGDLSAHQGDQPGGDGQAQAGAAVLPRGGGVLLLEGPEDFLLPVLGDADAGVLHRKL